MNILFISAASSIHTERWVNALVEKGNQVTLVSLPDHQVHQNKINSNVQIEYLPFYGNKGYYFNAFALRKIYKKSKPDIVNVHYASGYGTLARIAKIPDTILSVWGSDVYDFPYQSKWKMNVIKRNLKYARRIASTSHVMAEQVKTLIGDVSITVTPFGVDIDLFRKMPEVTHEGFVVGTVKTLSSKYGIDTIIKAFALFCQRVGDTGSVRLVIYGRGESEQKLRELCKKEQIEDKVYFGGFIPNNKVPQILNEMDVCCFGSRMDSESFGVAAVEAMACEIPVIATNVDGFKEVISVEECGFIVHRDAPEEMAECILKLYHSAELRNRVGKNGRKQVLQNYNWDNNMETMLKLYKNVRGDMQRDG